MPKKILNTKEEKAKFYKGMDALADTVTSTLGYAGKPVLISRGAFLEPEITKDGWYTARATNFEDWIEDAGAMLLKTNAKKTADSVGDNTTTVTLLGQFIINEGNKLIENGANPRKVKQGIDKAVKLVTDYLDSISIKINGDNEKIKQVATISANNDEVIGKMISDMYLKIGEQGRIELEESGSDETIVDVKGGAEIQRGYFDKDFINHPTKPIIELKDAYFVVYDYDINKVAELQPVLISLQETLQKKTLSGIPIIFYANDFSPEVYQTCIANNKNMGTQLICMKPTSSYRKECLEDICSITGATLIAIENNLVVKDGNESSWANFGHAGKAGKVTITKDYILIVDGEGDKELFKKRTDYIQGQIDHPETPIELKEILEKRLALISGSIGIIKAGGITTLEMTERKARIEDAVKATKCAIEEGVIQGGGKAMMLCSDMLNKHQEDDRDIEQGIELVGNALYAPINKMLKNASYYEGECSQIINDIQKSDPLYGYNFKTEEIENLIDAGVIDATKVVKHAIVNAAALGGQVITSGSFVIEVPSSQSNN